MTRRQRSGLVAALLLALAAGWLGSEALRGGRASSPAGEDAKDQEIAALKDRVAVLEHEAAAGKAPPAAVRHGNPTPAPPPPPAGTKPKPGAPEGEGETPAPAGPPPPTFVLPLGFGNGGFTPVPADAAPGKAD